MYFARHILLRQSYAKESVRRGQHAVANSVAEGERQSEEKQGRQNGKWTFNGGAWTGLVGALIGSGGWYAYDRYLVEDEDDREERRNKKRLRREREQLLIEEGHVREAFVRFASANSQTGKAKGKSEGKVEGKGKAESLATMGRSDDDDDALLSVMMMNEDDFLKSVSTSINWLGREQRIQLRMPDKFRGLFRMFDANGDGLLSYEEYAQLNRFVLGTDNEYQVAFKLFDRDGDGLIGAEEFEELMSSLSKGSSGKMLPFVCDCEWVKLYFGDKMEAKLSYKDFTQMIKGFGAERMRQQFRHYDAEGTGLIRIEDFVAIVRSLARHRVPTRIYENLLKIAQLNPMYPDQVTYAQFVAFHTLLDHIPSYARVTRVACRDYGVDGITKDEFREAAQRATSVDITPLELDLIYLWFDLSGDGRLTVPEFQRVWKGLPRGDMLPATGTNESTTTLGRAAEAMRDGAIHFGLGAVAGGLGATVVYPIDMVKTRMQAQRSVVAGAAASSASASAAASSKVGAATRMLYKNSLDCFAKIVSREGVRGLYSGIGPQLVGVAPEKAIKLTVNDLLRNLFGRIGAEDKIHLPLEVLAGGGAGASQVLFTNPLEIVKIRLQMQGQLRAVERRAAMNICRELGFAGLYKGASACLLRDVPFSMIYFPTYAQLKTAFSTDEGSTTSYGLLAAGTIAGAPAAGLTTPADVIKTRLQVEARPGEPVYTGIRDCFWKIVNSEGPTALWKGCGARMLRSSPQFGCTLLTYELLQQYLFPGLPPKPPTNAPILQHDYEVAQKSHFLRAVERIESHWGIIESHD
jgi:solute carrier family 25 (mitochondrial aspartate/glutamate transporter), member 12/13